MCGAMQLNTFYHVSLILAVASEKHSKLLKV